jgi:alpha-D-xyloside xylohydrolase
MLPYLYSTGWETTISGIPMMRAMLLEYPDDLSARDLSRQYMLGGSLLVAPVFDQQKHHIYLPEGSWVDFETGRRICGGKWVVYPKDIEVIPMFLRENTVIPMLQTAPKHISDDNFRDLELVINIVDKLEQAYYDDGVEGKILAALADGVLDITLKDIPAEKFRIYAPEEITAITLNGQPKPFRKEGTFYLA